MLLQWKADSLRLLVKYVVFHLHLRLHALIIAYWYGMQYRSAELDALKRGRRTQEFKKKRHKRLKYGQVTYHVSYSIFIQINKGN